jgi:hypothetical protein
MEPWALASAVGTGAADFRQYFRLLVELYVVRHVDYFNMFFADLFLEIAEKRPQVLASEDKVPVGLLFESDTLNEVKKQIADQKAVAISHESLTKTLQFFRQDLAIRAELDGNDIRRAKELIAIRNLIVHHDGLMTDRFILETKWPRGRRGQRIEVSEDLLEPHHVSTEEIASRLSGAAAAKFNL